MWKLAPLLVTFQFIVATSILKVLLPARTGRINLWLQNQDKDSALKYRLRRTILQGESRDHPVVLEGAIVSLCHSTSEKDSWHWLERNFLIPHCELAWHVSFQQNSSFWFETGVGISAACQSIIVSETVAEQLIPPLSSCFGSVSVPLPNCTTQKFWEEYPTI